jgi:hypothetical protein
MKKAASILFLTLFLCNVFIYYPVFLFYKSEIKAKRSVIAESETCSEKIIVFTVNSGGSEDWEWIEKNEFRRNGILYDVVKTEKYGNIIQYYCYADNNEMKLFEGLNHFIKNITDTNNSGKKETKNPAKVFFNDYFPVNNESNNIFFNDSEKPNIPILPFLSFIPEKTSPPPKV